MSDTNEIKTDLRRVAFTVPMLRQKKQNGEKIVMVTAYDYPSAVLIERAGVDVALVGDTLGIMSHGYKNTLPVTMEETLNHVQAVRRGLKRTLLLADMPFGSYQVSLEEAMRNAILLMKEGGAQAVKIEGGQAVLPLVRRMTESGIPVFGHLGLTPQSVHLLGGHKAQGRTMEAAQGLCEDAVSLEAAGAIGIVLETIPADLAAEISAQIAIPTIGIGAGPGCDGQVQVWHDLLGLPPGRLYRHVKRYADLGSQIENALRAYAEEVKQGSFPTKEHSL
jgi:3-methyl-2-oxobutanoate hydroxymethyltransferase